jgi:Flp pilus assembly protein TadD
MTLVAVAILAAACTKNEGNRAPSTPLVSSQEVPVTSSSPEARALFGKGVELAYNARVNEAVELLKKAVALDPGFATAQALLADFTPGPEGLKLAEKAMSLAAGLPEAERLRIRMIHAVRRGDFPEARGMLRQLASLVPNDWRVQLQLGHWAFSERQWDKAIAALRRASELNPAAGEPYNLMGYALARQGRHDEAVAAIQKYAQLKPEEPNPRDSLGELLMGAGRLAEAEAAFLSALKLSPKFWMAWEGVAIGRFARGDWVAGRDALARSREAAGRPEERLKLDEMLALSYEAEGKPAQADQAVEGAEKAAAAAGLTVHRVYIPIWRAWRFAERGEALEVLRLTALALQRSKELGLSGKEAKGIQERVNFLELRAYAKLGRLAEARKRLAALRGTGCSECEEAMGQSILHLAEGLLDLAEGDTNGAVRHLSMCVPEHVLCQWTLLQTQEKLGDAAGAAATRQKLLGPVYRDMIHVYVRAKLGALGSK